jgi:hypothetical protein
MAVIHKTSLTSKIDGQLNFILSDTSLDSFDDVVGDENHPTLGWDFTTFRANPIALWSHDSRQPIGRWENIRVQDKAVHGQLVLAPIGASPRIDELRALIDAAWALLVLACVLLLAAEINDRSVRRGYK